MWTTMIVELLNDLRWLNTREKQCPLSSFHVGTKFKRFLCVGLFHPVSFHVLFSVPLSVSLVLFLPPPLCCALSLSVTPLLLTSLSISLNISKEWITLGCHLALAKNSFLWVKCFKLSSLTGTISYNNYMDGPWLGTLSFHPSSLSSYTC